MIQDLVREITALWQTDELRRQRPSPIDGERHMHARTYACGRAPFSPPPIDTGRHVPAVAQARAAAPGGAAAAATSLSLTHKHSPYREPPACKQPCKQQHTHTHAHTHTRTHTHTHTHSTTHAQPRPQRRAAGCTWWSNPFGRRCPRSCAA